MAEKKTWPQPEHGCIKYDPEHLSLDDVYDCETIVIGSGIGGLAAASLLAQAGQKVLVLEQHWVAGGCLHTFKSNGYRFGTGLHYVGDMGSGNDHPLNSKNVLDSLTLADDPVVWDKIEDPIETAIIGAPSSKYEKVADLEKYKAYLIEKFPEEKAGIEEYFRVVDEASAAFERSFIIKSLPLPVASLLTWTGLHRLFDAGYNKWSKKTLQEVLEDLTTNKELQAVLASNYFDCGTDPGHSPFLLHAGVLKYYSHGAYYPHGGPSTIAGKIIKCIQAHDGKVMVCARVKNILLKNGNGKKAVGVEMQDGTLIKAKKVVSDIGLINTAKHLLPEGVIHIDIDEDGGAGGSGSFRKLHASQAMLELFVGLPQDSEILNLPTGVYFIHPSNDLVGTVEKLEKMTLEEALRTETVEEAMEGEFNHIGGICLTVPSKHDKAWKEQFPGKTAIEIMAYVPWKWFEPFADQFDPDTRSHGPDYEAAKLRLADKMWQRVVEVFEADCPNLPKGLESIETYHIGTPLTFSRFLGSEHGGALGLDHDMKRFEPRMHYLRLRPEVPEVSGLYLCGQDVSTCGITGAMMGGLLCASKVLKVDNPADLLRKKQQEEGA